MAGIRFSMLFGDRDGRRPWAIWGYGNDPSIPPRTADCSLPNRMGSLVWMMLQPACIPDAGPTSGAASTALFSPVTASLAVTIAAFSSVSAGMVRAGRYQRTAAGAVKFCRWLHEPARSVGVR